MNDYERLDLAIDCACGAAKITKMDFFGKKRGGVLPSARKTAAWLCRKYTLLSHREIATMIGYKEHSMSIKGVQDCDEVTRYSNEDFFRIKEQATKAFLIAIENESTPITVGVIEQTIDELRKGLSIDKAIDLLTAFKKQLTIL